ncbi:MAG: single-stranded DNA-binding protein [Nocardioides sp.]|uniref:single-stranded DNA-binding protein n=1 Tax=Nocardioides sp. TaxID=35761 RepID=UPI0039E2EEC4
MNDTHISFCGWVGSDVTLTEIGNGASVASFRVGSTPRRFRNGSWEDGTTAWYTVKAWRALAEHVHDSVRQGDAVMVQGRLEADVWDKGDGTKSVRYVVVATAIGHDLNRGTSSFTKTARKEDAADREDPRVREVIHSYDESGPRLNHNGEELTPAEPAA